jgi:dCTP deaminase
MLSAAQIADRLATQHDAAQEGRLVIRPSPDQDRLRASGSASVDLRLGTWFSTMRQSKMSLLRVGDELAELAADASLSPLQLKQVSEYVRGTISANEANLTKTSYVPFGEGFVLHPGNFVLGVTLEWIRLPNNIAGYVIGKSSWGRRGLIIATAVGVHPNFTGCLTLELTNVAEVPIAIKPGMFICQLFMHEVPETNIPTIRSPYSCTRRPALGQLQLDDFAKRLSRGIQF